MTVSPAATSVQSVPGVGQGAPLRVAMIVPPWITVLPAGYGGIETVVWLLCEELVARGMR
jgi:hypothetical protein